MSQLALDLLSGFPPRLENFVPGPNDEALALLQALAEASAGAPGERQLHLWGPPGSGKSHLLRALAERLGPAARLIGPDDPPAAYGFTGDEGGADEAGEAGGAGEPADAADAADAAGTADAASAARPPLPAALPPAPAATPAPTPPSAPPPAFARAPAGPAQLRLDLEANAARPGAGVPDPGIARAALAGAEPGPSVPPGPPRLWLIDDVHALDAPRQAALFGLVNRVRGEAGTALVTAADAPPLGLALREDLRTRLGWGRVLGLKPLTDEDKALALLALAARRGVAMSAEVPAWLLAHSSRDMRALIALFDALDRHALARQRAITLPLLRDYLQREL